MPRYNITTGIPDYPPGLSDSDTALVLPLYRAVTNLARRLSEVTGQVQYDPVERFNLSPFTNVLGADASRVFAAASEAIPYGNLVNLYESGGALFARRADRTLGYVAHGIAMIPGTTAAGTQTEVLFMQGKTSSVGNAVMGTHYWLDAAGVMTSVKPTSGIIQVVGWGLGSGGFYLNIEAPR